MLLYITSLIEKESLTLTAEHRRSWGENRGLRHRKLKEDGRN
jgi:hypothetical protein